MSLLLCQDSVGYFLFTLSVLTSAALRTHIRRTRTTTTKTTKGPSYYDMPENAMPYKRTKVFEANSIPKGLQNNHNTAAGVWALIHVLRGTLLYVVAPDERSQSEQSFILDEHCNGLIAPRAYHRICALSDDMQCYVEFLKIPCA